MESKATAPAQSGGGHGLEAIFFFIEKPLYIPVLLVMTSCTLTFLLGHGIVYFIFSLIWLPILVAAGLVGPLVLFSWLRHSGPANWEPYFLFKDAALSANYAGAKIPVEVFYEAYMKGSIDLKQDLYEIFLHRYEIFKFCITINDLKFYVLTFLGQNLTHTTKTDHGEIAPVYNRGNDFYNWFLGDIMIYTSGIYRSRDDDLTEAQTRKLDTVCEYVQMKPGDKHLDIGCGWGTLICHAAKNYGTASTGVTLASEQAAWCMEQAEKKGVEGKVNVLTMDYRMIPYQKFNKITCLEMAEHVGIKNFQKFLLQVKGMLEDDGIFYLQIAGLRRAWQYEDLAWGLFMAKYIFPGADASCPLGWVTSQLERAGFEVHRVENCGVHYSLTIKAWYDNWIKNKEPIVKKYGEYMYRQWVVFLGWSAIIAAQGTSTVFMITCTKNTKVDIDSVARASSEQSALSRMTRWVGPKPIATQQ